MTNPVLRKPKKAKKAAPFPVPPDIEESPSYSWMARFLDKIDASMLSKQVGRCLSSDTDFGAILKNVTRTANVIGNSRDDEKELQVKWSNAEDALNVSTSDTIYVSPDIVNPRTTLKMAWTLQQLTDVIIGEVLTESAMKRTMDSAVEKILLDDRTTTKDRKSFQIHRTWLVSERLYARHDTLKQYPGFKPYFDTSRNYYTSKQAANNIEAVCNLHPNANAVIDALHWTMQQEQQLNLREDLSELVTRLAELIKRAETSKERHVCTIAAIEEIFRLFPPPPGASPPEDTGSPNSLRGDVPSANTQVSSDPPCSKELTVVGRSPESYDPPKNSTEVHMNRSPGYAKAIAQLQEAIEALRWRLNFASDYERDIEHGLRRGRVDEGSIYKLGFGEHAEDTLFENEEIPAPKDIVVALLVDESGSMAYQADVTTMARSQTARNIAIVTANALMRIKGVTPVVVGHTAQVQHEKYPKGSGSWSHEGTTLIHYLTPENDVPSSMWRIHHREQNIDGVALGMLAKKLHEWYPMGHKIIVHLNDGTPEANGYRGEEAVEHTAKMVAMIRNSGIGVTCVGIDDYTETRAVKDAYRTMYGKDFVLVSTHKAFAAIANTIVKAVAEVCRK